MKKVFLDTNVVLDYYLDREGFSDIRIVACNEKNP